MLSSPQRLRFIGRWPLSWLLVSATVTLAGMATLYSFRREIWRGEWIAQAKEGGESSGVAQRVQFEGAEFDTYTVDLRTSKLGFYYRTVSNQRIGSMAGLKEYLKSQNRELLFATNAGMFTPTHEPVGLYVENGQQIEPLNLEDGSGNFFLRPNGVFFISDQGASILDSQLFQDAAKFEKILYATQSGPMLLDHSEVPSSIHSSSTNTNIRSGVGLIDANRIVFAISDSPVTFYSFARMFREKFHCSEALYLDGAISEMYLPTLHRYDLGGDFGVMIGVTR